MLELREVFSPLLGELAWSVKLGHGSYVTMEFGQPHLLIREPVKTGGEGRVSELLSRRKVSVVGDWHFWIRDAEWRAFNGDKQGTSNDASHELDKLLASIDGQRLTSVEVRNESLALNFDLGALISIVSPQRPIANLEMWTLYEFEKDHVSCLSDNSLVAGRG